VTLTDGAASKVKALLDQEGRDDLRLRVAVQPGGCSGLRYQLFFDERSLDGDQLHDFAGVGVVVDRMSAPYLLGATIDFVDTIEKQGFTIDNPAGRPPPTRHNGWIDGGSRLPRPSGTIRCHTAGQSLPGGRSW
jgi:iron-sulfur cluster assembly accessory protein